MPRANSCSRTSKRRRSDAVPSVGMRLCVGDRAIPTETKIPYDDEGNDVRSDFVLLTSRDANLKWLEEPLGHDSLFLQIRT